MRGTVKALTVGGVLAALALLSPGGRAQTPEMPDKVKFNSVDGVELHGTFYGSSKNDSAPTVLVVHAIGDSSRRKEYDTLARTLQASGLAVLTFDLRGHGQSKSVDKDEFWSQKYKNYQFVAGAAARKETIEFRDIDKRYYSVFVNDLAAAKAFLDRKNDAKKCNSSSLIVIGADSGATLGAIWINSEWARYKLVPPANGFGQPQPDLKNPEGKNIICGIWLSITPDLGGRKVSLRDVLFTSAKEKKVPMVFLYNSDYSTDKSTAVTLEKGIKGKDKVNFTLTAASPVKAGGKLTGRELLNPSLETDKAIAAYLPKVIDDKGNEWQEQESRKAQYVWKIGLQTMPARLLPADTAIRFSLYTQFMSR